MEATEVVSRIRARVGEESAPVECTIEAGHLRRWCEAIGDPNPRWREEAPPTFLVALVGGSLNLLEALDYGRGWLNGGDSFEYFEPVRVGDVLVARRRLVDVYEKEGRSGRMLFLVIETVFTDQSGRAVGVLRGTRIRR